MRDDLELGEEETANPSVVNLALVLAASVGGRLASEARVGLRGGEVGRGASILAASVGEGSASRG